MSNAFAFVLVLSLALNALAMFSVAAMSAAASDLRQQLEQTCRRLHKRCHELSMWRRRYPDCVFSHVHPWEVEKRMLPARLRCIIDSIEKDNPFAAVENGVDVKT